jgi:hypothetical protein
MAVAQTYQNELPDIKKKVDNWHRYFKNNIDRFHTFRYFIYKSNLTSLQKNALQELNRDPLEFNIVEAYVSRLVGEFSKQEPSIEVMNSPDTAVIDPAIIDLIEGNMRCVLQEANNNNFEEQIYKDILTGGFSVAEVYTDYKNNSTFNQEIFLRHLADPTMCGFDPFAVNPSKSDGEYCFALYPQTKEVFQQNYPDISIDKVSFARSSIGNFSFSYFADTNTPVVLVGKMYIKKHKRVKLIYAADNRTYTNDDYQELLSQHQKIGTIHQPPVILKTRWADQVKICCYEFIETEVIDYYETDYDSLPLVFFDGNSALVREGGEGSTVTQLTRPYIQNTISAQKLKNVAAQVIAKEIDFTSPTKFMIDKDAIPENYLETWLQPQKAGSLIFQSTDKAGRALPAPIPVQRMGLPPEIFGIFNSMDQSIQMILGAYDSSLGINDNQLSGAAITAGAMQSNAAAYPYILGFIQGLNQISQIILQLIPKYYVTPRTIPVIKADGSRDYKFINDPNNPKSNIKGVASDSLQVSVQAGVNFEVQKQQSLQTIISLMNISQSFKAMMEQMGLPILLSNISIRGADQLEVLSQQWQQQQAQIQQQQQQAAQQQGQMQNPQMAKIQLDQVKLQQEDKWNTIEAQQKAQEMQIDQLRTVLTYLTHQQHDAVALKAVAADKDTDDINLALEKRDQDHRHTRDLTKDVVDMIARQPTEVPTSPSISSLITNTQEQPKNENG